MREIKFRARRIDDGKWAYGYYLKTPITAEFLCEGQFFDTGVGRHCIVQNNVAHEIDPETLGQYTGVEDKNDKEIYDGDIIRWGSNGELLANVKWHHERPAFVMRRRSVWHDAILTIYANTEIIGNIYENPELQKISSERYIKRVEPLDKGKGKV